MKTYKVKVNGKSYIVELESIEESTKSMAETKKEPTKEKVEKKESSKAVDCTEILSPIQGNVIDVKVSVGQKVKAGDILLLIEAMKLENEVNSSVDGEVKEVLVSKGQNVSTNELLIRIK